METLDSDDEGASTLREYIYYAPADMEPGASLVFAGSCTATPSRFWAGDVHIQWIPGGR